jgi:hypothetical protein
MFNLPEYHTCLDVVMVCGFWLFTFAMVIGYIKAFVK